MANNLRYMIINSVFGVSAKLTHRAISFKGCCCNPYEMAALVEFCKLKADLVTVYVDEKIVLEDFPMILMGVFNTKYGGSNMLLSPLSVVNDGMIELLVYQGKIGFMGLVKTMDNALKHRGVHCYDENLHFYRGRTFRVENKNPPPQPKRGETGEQ